MEGGTKGIWGKGVNWEHEIMVDSTEIFSSVIIYSLFPYLEVLFLERNLKRCFERGMRASGEWRNLFGSVPPWFVDQKNDTWQVWSLEGRHTIKYQFLWYTETQHPTSDSRHWWYTLQRRGDPADGLWQHLGGSVQLPGLVLPWDGLTWAGKRELSSHNHGEGKGDSELQQLSVLYSGWAQQAVVLSPHTQSCSHPVCVCWGDFLSDFSRKWGICYQPNFFSLCLSMAFLK